MGYCFSISNRIYFSFICSRDRQKDATKRTKTLGNVFSGQQRGTPGSESPAILLNHFRPMYNCNFPFNMSPPSLETTTHPPSIAADDGDSVQSSSHPFVGPLSYSSSSSVCLFRLPFILIANKTLFYIFLFLIFRDCIAPPTKWIYR